MDFRLPITIAAVLCGAAMGSAEQSTSVLGEFVGNYCLDCHNAADVKGGLDLESFDPDAAARPGEWDTAGWEKMLLRLSTRQMPPADYLTPDEAEYEAVIAAMEQALDAAADRHPQPGRTDSVRRLNRTEYAYAIRDLLGLNIDAEELLPPDQESAGFDNVTLGDLTPTLLSRYLSAAESIAREAVGGRQRTPGGFTLRLPADRTQQAHEAGLPLGTRGGVVFDHHFAQAGEYEIQLRLARDRDEHVEGLHRPHDIDLLVDGELLHRFTVRPVERARGQSLEFIDQSLVDKHLRFRFPVSAGDHRVGVTFPRQGASLSENKRQPFDAAFNRHRHPRPEPALYEVSIAGPFHPTGPGDTESRQRSLGEPPHDPSETEQAAERALRRLLRLAYRRATSADDLAAPMEFFRRGLQAGGLGQSGYEAGMQLALTSILVNPHFLLRVESDPPGVEPGEVYPVSDSEIASRLSFFLWSSLPDEELLALAERGTLHEPQQLRRQVRRMLADERSQSLVTNFAAQWLHLRNLDSLRPDMRSFPDFDDNLRTAMRQETELLFSSVVGDDRSVVDLISTDTTFLNERLAVHYGIPGVLGSHFRAVRAPSDSHRGGLLRQASILAVTSYTTRTSPTIRGSWVLENLIGTPPPPPPPNVESLKERPASVTLTMRERLAHHRANPSCAVCHDVIDPIGFALENFDAVGRWRQLEGEQPVDSTGRLPDGREVDGVEELEQGLVARPKVFVRALTEKLLTFALGRGVEPSDGPAVRQIVHQAAEKDYCFSSLIEGIVLSDPFLLREAATPPTSSEGS